MAIDCSAQSGDSSALRRRGCAASLRGAAAGVGTLAIALLAVRAHATSCTVPSSPFCATIQSALDQAAAGDTITLDPGTYFEKISFSNSGSTGGGFITLQGAPGNASVLDGTGVPGANMVLIDSRSYVKVVGLDIRNNLNVHDGSGVRILGAGTHIEIRNNKIHDIRGSDAMGVTVYGTEASSIANLIIDGNEIYDCQPARSETLTLNGNVEIFEVTNNIVRDVNNIGIDFIGGETDLQPDTTKVARNGVCRNNQVYRARSVYGGGYAGAIYVDGGRDIVIERNITAESDLGLEVGAENAGIVARNITVRDNVIHHNDKAGIVFGGYDAAAGRVQSCTFLNNTLYHNDTLGTGVGELWIQYASNNVIRDNLIYGSPQNVLLYSESGNVNNTLDYNLWFADTGAASATLVWRGTPYNGFAAYQAGAGQDAHSLFANPLLVNPAGADFHLASVSPAVNAGDPGFVPGGGETDIDGAPRVSGGRVDAGADEVTCGDGVVDPGEICDDHNLTDCDGCDSNCTPSSQCGNGIRCGAEQCDDGNSANGDCCSSVCTYEALHAGCDDQDLCSNDDQCDGGGRCVGTAAPVDVGVCHQPTQSAKSLIQLRDQTPSDRDSAKWRWSRGQLTDRSELGNPETITRYALCVYDQSASAQPRMNTTVPAGGICAGRPCWAATTHGFKYKNRNADAAGIQSLTLKAGDVGKASMALRGKGASLPMPVLGLVPPVIVQLRNSTGACWGATYSTARVSRPEAFAAKSD